MEEALDPYYQGFKVTQICSKGEMRLRTNSFAMASAMAHYGTFSCTVEKQHAAVASGLF